MTFRAGILRACAMVLAFHASVGFAASITVQVADTAGHPLEDAVVYAEPLSGQTVPRHLTPVEIEQKGRKFLPLVTVVQAGTDISFPNNDTVRHHVYSFSPAKTFELKLYSGKPSKPENFDKPGTVVLGCNIHDQMLAYVEVVNTPYFAKTDATGKAIIDSVVPGRYALKVWHYGLPQGTPVPEQALILGSGDLEANFSLNAKPLTR
jgi:plastocyanin